MDIDEDPKSDFASEELITSDRNIPIIETDGYVESAIQNEVDESGEEEEEQQQESSQSLEPLTIPTSNDESEIDNHNTTTSDPAATTTTTTAPPIPTLLIPCLKGRLFVEGTAHICRGVWAMSEELHNQPGQVGDFEFRLIKADESAATTSFPKNGKYQGYFFLKQPPPSKSPMKVDDRDMIMTFVQSGEDEYTVQGEGVNRFGSFSLRGTLQADGTILMYRSYTTVSTKPIVVKKRTVSPNHEREKSAKKRQLAAATIPLQPQQDTAATPAASLDISAGGRDSMGGRIRKAKSFGDEGVNTPKTPRAPAVAAPAPVAAKPTTATKAAIKAAAKAAAAPVSAPVAAAVVPVNVSNRVQRVSLPMQKCSDLLKELLKQPLAVWFSVPVDHVALNIPDYPTIITHPMDFSTVKANLDANKYTVPDEFAEHIRLIFRNAKTYNVSRENPVHIAALELGGRFEERYRSMMANLAQNPVLSQALNLPEDIVPVTASSSKKGPGKGTGRASSGGGGGSLQRQLSSASVSSAKRGLGPRVESLVPAPLDVSAHIMNQMQRQMQEMQDEIMKLRTAVRVSDVQQQIFSQRDAAQNPLTYEEKKLLVTQIQHMEDDSAFQSHIVDIVRTSSTYQPRDDGEVAIDELDTLTLRKIQKYVAENYVDNSGTMGSPGKKTKKGPGPGKPSAAATKKPKAGPISSFAPVPATSTASSAVLETAAAVHAPTPVASSNDHFAVPTQEDEDEMLESGDMLFDAGNFEVLRSQAYDGYASDQGSDMGEREENDDDAQVGVALYNADAWTKGPATARPSAAVVSTTKESTVWREAANEMHSALERETNVRQEQARVAELKASYDADRLAQLQRQAVERSQQQERAEMDALRETERAAEALRRQREEERQRLSTLSRTVHMDSHAEDEEMRMFVDGADM